MCRYLVLAISVCMLIPSGVCAGMDNALYAEVLSRYVKDGRVDYADLKAHRKGLDRYLEEMGDVQVDELARDEQLAFYINLYNAATLQLIIDNCPVESIKDIGSFFSSPWKQEVVELEGKMVSLDHVEHDIIRPRFKDPRVHFALNCSAISCPPLMSVHYEAAILHEQLEQAAIRFINDGVNNYLDGKTLYVSKIFTWFAEDFPDDFIGWFISYSHGSLRKDLKKLLGKGGAPTVRYLKYDWSLNAQ